MLKRLSLRSQTCALVPCCIVIIITTIPSFTTLHVYSIPQQGKSHAWTHYYFFRHWPEVQLGSRSTAIAAGTLHARGTRHEARGVVRWGFASLKRAAISTQLPSHLQHKHVPRPNPTLLNLLLILQSSSKLLIYLIRHGECYGRHHIPGRLDISS